VDRH
ncbi:cheW-like domain protein, partial [Vibrio harveyi]|jgi:hypothetical protein